MGMTHDGLSYWQAETTGEPLLEITIGDLLDQRATEIPTQEAIVYSGYPEFGDALNFRWNYAEYRAQVNAVAKGLMMLGLNKGDHIAVLAINLPEWPLLQLAAAKTGLVLVTINPLLRAAEIEYILKQGDVRVLFLMAQIRDSNCLAVLRSLTTPGDRPGAVRGEGNEHLPLLRYLCLMGMPPDDLTQDSWRPALFPEMVAAGRSISDEALVERQASVTPDDPGMILYTSGTTGFPKGAVLTHRNLLNNANLVVSQGGLKYDIHGCVLVPFFHIFGCVGYILVGLCSGGSIYPLLGFDPLKAMQIISKERCTITGGVPTMLMAMLHHPDFAHYDLSSLKQISCAGAPVPVALMEEVKERIGADIIIAFGQTENTGAMTLTLADDPFERKAATVGKALPHTDVKIINPATGKEVPIGERGEICCRGFLVMKGYYNMPDKTAAAIDAEGWLHTGDLATMDEHGYINIVGRLKEMVIRGGENLFPREIEEFLLRHPKVADAQVLGVPDKYYGEELLAVILPRAGEQLSEQELRDYCHGQISRQKIPRYFQFVESYPMTASGKVQKFVLRARAMQALGLEEATNVKTA